MPSTLTQTSRLEIFRAEVAPFVESWRERYPVQPATSRPIANIAQWPSQVVEAFRPFLQEFEPLFNAVVGAIMSSLSEDECRSASAVWVQSLAGFADECMAWETTVASSSANWATFPALRRAFSGATRRSFVATLDALVEKIDGILRNDRAGIAAPESGYKLDVALPAPFGNDLESAFEAFEAEVRSAMQAVVEAADNPFLGPPSRYIPAAVKAAVYERDRGCCAKCGVRHGLHFDHILAFSKGGGNTVENVQLLCQACNLRKGARWE